jgi:arylsulfate sulfotransferase
VIVTNAVAGKKPIRLSIDPHQLRGESFRASIRARRPHRSFFGLRRFGRIAENLRCRGVIKPRRLGLIAHDFEQPQCRHSRVVAGRLGNLETQPDVALPRQMINLARLHFAKNPSQGRRVGQIAIVQKQTLVVDLGVAPQMLDPRAEKITRPPHDPVDRIALSQKQLGQIRAVLSGDTRNQRDLVVTHGDDLSMKGANSKPMRRLPVRAESGKLKSEMSASPIKIFDIRLSYDLTSGMLAGKIWIPLIASVAALHPLSAAAARPARIESARARQSLLGPRPVSKATSTAIIGSQTPGPTPFIVQINTTVSPIGSFVSVQFTVVPKPGSVTRPISATYSGSYLFSRNYINVNTGAVVVPVFGLYANYSNTVTLTFSFSDGSTQTNNVTVLTPNWTDTCGGAYNNPTVVQARTTTTALSYDYVLIKNICGSQTPVIMDTDGNFRWVGPTGFDTPSSIFFWNGIYVSSPPPSGGGVTGFSRVDFDGTITFVQDYSGIGVTATNHHNVDPGRDGMLWEVNTTSQTESVILEVDTFGNVLNTWNFANIISQAMTAGGDDPSQFVGTGTSDWFHNNANTYKKSDNTFISSSRENFVIAVDYDSQQIKWILGDPTKQWHQFPSLQSLALTLGANTLPPIGQHAVSITRDNNLLLFDDGLSSLNHGPSGADRTYSAPRKYQIDTQGKIALEIWNYPNGQSVYSAICSSTYEDAPVNYLIGYADETTPGNPFGGTMVELVGLTNATTKVFDYNYASTPCAAMWNAIPIHLEALRFTAVQPLKAVSRKTHGSAGTFDIDLPLTGGKAIEPRAGNYQVVVTFATNVGVNGATVTPGNGGTASVSGAPIVSGHQITVNLTNVSSAQTLAVNLIGVTAAGSSDNVSIPMSVLVGDVDASDIVDGNDVSAVQSQTRQPVTSANFRDDVNANGLLDGNDVSLTQGQTRTSLP